MKPKLNLWKVAWDAWRTTRGGWPAIAARQESRLRDLVAFARHHAPVYRDLYHDLPTHFEDSQQIPPVTKGMLMARFDEWVTDPEVTHEKVAAFLADPTHIGELFLGRYLAWTTSGSTGEPAILLQDSNWLTVMTALSAVRVIPAWLSFSWMRGFLRNRRTAVLLATGGHYIGVVMAERERRRSQRWARNIRVLSVLKPVPELVQELNTFQPAQLMSYPSMLAILAHEQAAGRLAIHPFLLMSAGETLYPTMRAQIEAAFGTRVWDSYSASETGVIAYECRQRHLHVNADWILVEPVDEHYQPVPPEHASHTVLVTNLANRVQPIIRYDLGDSIILLSEPCPCGSPLPAIHVEGRIDEILTFRTATGKTVELLPMGLATLVEQTPGVHRFQVIQTGPAALKIRLEAEDPQETTAVWQAVRQRLRNYLNTFGLSNVRIERDPAPPARHPRSGKYRHVWSEIPENL